VPIQIEGHFLFSEMRLSIKLRSVNVMVASRFNFAVDIRTNKTVPLSFSRRPHPEALVAGDFPVTKQLIKL
jgi:hypothetical protein